VHAKRRYAGHEDHAGTRKICYEIIELDLNGDPVKPPAVGSQ
jgi:hypothetical protein